MDQDRWMTSAAASTRRKNNQAISRYEYDMAQAQAMRGVARSSKASELGAQDYTLALKGLKSAQSYKVSGNLESALRLYELSIELLIKFLKSDIGTTDRRQVNQLVETALSEAEEVKQRIKGGTKKKKAPQQESFRNLSSALSTAIVTPIATKRQRPKKKGATSPTLSQTSSASQRSVLSGISDDMGKTILADFFVPPSDLTKTNWDDVAGLSDVKQALQEVGILPLTRPDLFTGLRKPQNILLYGPPGTGKTMLVRAVAHESGSSLFACSASVLTSKWMGDAEKLVRRLFAVAKVAAPSIVFLDEMDSLLSSRKSDGEHEASRRLKTEFMVQLDGVKGIDDQGQVLLIACTNCPWDVDSAVLRRFPRRIYVPLPDPDARRALVKNLLKKIGKHSVTSRQVTTLVKRTDGFSCSDIAALASEASFGPLRSLGDLHAIQNCEADQVRPVVLSDFETVLTTSTKSVSDAQLEKYHKWQQEQSI